MICRISHVIKKILNWGEVGCILWDRLKVLCHPDDLALNDAGVEISNTYWDGGDFQCTVPRARQHVWYLQVRTLHRAQNYKGWMVRTLNWGRHYKGLMVRILHGGLHYKGLEVRKLNRGRHYKGLKVRTMYRDRHYKELKFLTLHRGGTIKD